MGLLHESLGDLDAALHELDAALAIVDRSNDPAARAIVLGNLGLAYMNANELDLALEVFERSLSLSDEAHGNAASANSLANLGDVHLLRGEFEQAEAYHRDALALRLAGGRQREVAFSYHSLGQLALSRGELEMALRLHEDALEMRQDLGLAPEIALSLVGLGQVYGELGRNADAVAFVSEGLALVGELGLPRRQRAALSELLRLRGEAPGAASASELLPDEGAEAPASLVEAAKMALHRGRIRARLEAEEVLALRRQCAHQELASSQDAVLRRALWAGIALLAMATLVGWWAWGVQRLSHGRLVSTNRELAQSQKELRFALGQLRRLEGLLPICAHCKSVRNDAGDWLAVEEYIAEKSEAQFSHGICPDCADFEFPGVLSRPEARTRQEHAGSSIDSASNGSLPSAAHALSATEPATTAARGDRGPGDEACQDET